MYVTCALYVCGMCVCDVRVVYYACVCEMCMSMYVWSQRTISGVIP